MDKDRRIKRICQFLIVCAAAALLVVCGLFYIPLSGEKGGKQGGNEADTWKAEAEYVKADTGMAEETESSGKSKRVIKVVEVIPHPICSIFPYLVDWGTQEEYNKELDIGYNGLQYLVSTNGNLRGEKNWVAVDGTKEQFDELAEYDFEFEAATGDHGVWQPKWWRMYENTNILDVNGYFEYVGEGKGLYTINTDVLVEKGDTTANGIRYEMTAVERKGSENPKGDYAVQSPVCYIEKRHTAAAVSSQIKSQTEYNYVLSFDCETTQEKDYRVDTVTSVSGGTNRLDYEYYAYLKEGATWNYGYEYQGKGNYQPGEYTSQRASSIANANYEGYYLRVESSTKRDQIAGIPGGYFKKYEDSDSSLVGPDTILYHVTFVKNESGCYVLSDAGVKKEIEQDSASAIPGTVYSNILFDYVGKGKGVYDVSFIYAPSGALGGSAYAGAKYAVQIEAVSFQAGRYALASEEEKEDLYITGNGDYAKLITSIDCRGIEYDRGSDGRSYDSGTQPVGLSMGLTTGNQERGSWIFHAYEEGETPGFTKADQVKSARIIYVYRQNRKKCYYEHNAFSNNEWFKLLIYMSNDGDTEPLAWQDYENSDLTGKQIKQKYKDKLDEFDNTYQIEIVQKTPEELTVKDVEDAALLYFSEEIGVNGLEGQNEKGEYYWNVIKETYRKELPIYNGETKFDYQSDFSTEVLFAIYRNCMYDQTTALMFGYDMMEKHLEDDGKARSNLGKMLMMLDLLDSPARFAEFIDGYAEKKSEYSTINPDGTVTAYKNNSIYNAGTQYLLWDKSNEEWKQKAGTEIEPQIENVWDESYFMVHRLIEYEWYIGVENNNVSPINGCKLGFPGAGSAYLNKDVEDDWTWYTIHDLTSFVRANHDKIINIWKILHNRNSMETSEPVVVVTNAAGVNRPVLESMLPVYYFYVDPYSIAAATDFDVDFRMNWVPEEVTVPNSLISAVVTEEGAGGVVFRLDNPEYKTDYTCPGTLIQSYFLQDGDLKPAMTTKDFRITVTDAEDKTADVIVRFVVREAFNLN